ncbi:PAS domain-containing protein, partial [Roseateles sp. GG27B]
MQEQPDVASDTAAEVQSARMRALLMRAPVALGFVIDGRFALVSEQFNHLFGHSDETDLAGQPARSVLVSDAAQIGLLDRMKAAFSSGRPLDEEIECVRGNGSRFWALLQATPLQWELPAGEALWIVDDVTIARQQRMQPTWGAKH